MWTVKTDQTGRMPRLIGIFAGHTGNFVCFAMLRHIYRGPYTDFQKNKGVQISVIWLVGEVLKKLPIFRPNLGV